MTPTMNSETIGHHCRAIARTAQGWLNTRTLINKKWRPLREGGRRPGDAGLTRRFFRPATSGTSAFQSEGCEAERAQKQSAGLRHTSRTTATIVVPVATENGASGCPGKRKGVTVICGGAGGIGDRDEVIARHQVLGKALRNIILYSRGNAEASWTASRLSGCDREGVANSRLIHAVGHALAGHDDIQLVNKATRLDRIKSECLIPILVGYHGRAARLGNGPDEGLAPKGSGSGGSKVKRDHVIGSCVVDKRPGHRAPISKAQRVGPRHAHREKNQYCKHPCGPHKPSRHVILLDRDN